MMRKTDAIRTLCFAAMLGGVGLGGAACDNDGPVENAAEEVGEGIEEAGEAVEDATD